MCKNLSKLSFRRLKIDPTNLTRWLRQKIKNKKKPRAPDQWGAFYLFIADFFAIQIIGGAKEF